MEWSYVITVKVCIYLIFNVNVLQTTHSVCILQLSLLNAHRDVPRCAYALAVILTPTWKFVLDHLFHRPPANRTFVTRQSPCQMGGAEIV